MNDYIVTGISASGFFRVIAGRTTVLVEEARRRHKTAKTATAALGRVVTGAGLVAASMNDDEQVTLRVLGDGPAGGLVSDAVRVGEHISVRGYMADPGADVPFRMPDKLDVGKLVGKNGFLHLTRDMGMKEQYTGSSRLQSGEIGIDLAYHLTVSEQIPSAVSLGVRVNGGKSHWVTGAGGVLIQSMPVTGNDVKQQERDISLIQDNLTNMESVSLQMQQGVTPEEMVTKIFSGVEDVEIMANIPVIFSCKCSRDRAVSTLAGLGREDLLRLIDEQGRTQVTCKFCSEVYDFSGDDLRSIAENLE